MKYLLYFSMMIINEIILIFFNKKIKNFKNFQKKLIMEIFFKF